MNTTSPRYRLNPNHIRAKQTESRGLRVWRYLHWLSIDVAVGAGVSAAWVNYAWGGDRSWWALLALSAGALWVYSVDHWADALRAAQRPPETLSPRRQFYVQSRSILFTLSLTSTLVGIWAAMHLPWSTLGFGAVFVLTCGAYLWITQKRQDSHLPMRYPKEMIVTTLYTLALTAWPLSQLLSAPDRFTPLKGLCTSLFIFFLAWANVCLISVHERKADAAEETPSLALWLGEYTTRNVGRGVLKFALLCWVVRTYLFVDWNDIGHVRTILDTSIAGAMLLTLWRLYQRPEWSRVNSRYRRWADLIFLYPSWILLEGWF